MKKNELRIYAKKIRKGLDILNYSKYFVNEIRNTQIYRNSKNVMLYYPINSEIDLRELINDDKNFFLPKICSKELTVCAWNKSDKLVLSECKTFEPCTNPIAPTILDLVIVPALMADSNGYRLGYGGGFYDRFIEQFGNCFHTLSVIPKELFIENLPREVHDKKIDTIVTRQI